MLLNMTALQKPKLNKMGQLTQANELHCAVGSTVFVLSLFTPSFKKDKVKIIENLLQINVQYFVLKSRSIEQAHLAQTWPIPTSNQSVLMSVLNIDLVNIKRSQYSALQGAVIDFKLYQHFTANNYLAKHTPVLTTRWKEFLRSRI